MADPWTDWHVAPENDDLWQPSDGADVWWSEAIGAGTGTRFWQVRAQVTPSPSGAPPELRRIDVNTVDTSALRPRARQWPPRRSPRPRRCPSRG